MGVVIVRDGTEFYHPAMPTRRMFLMTVMTVLATEIAFHGIFRPWFARNASQPGIVGDLSQAGLLIG